MRARFLLAFSLFLYINSQGQHTDKQDTNTYSLRLENLTEFTASNLPVVLINTIYGYDIPDEKVTAKMKIIDHSPLPNKIDDVANIYNGFVGIEVRGNFSATLPQLPYGFETRDSLENNLNVKLLGMPKENDWILLANYNDKSFMRNSLAFHIFREMGHYAPRTRHCEVMVNDDYKGIYVLTEKIKIDDGRVDIAKLDLDDNAGDSVSGGYILKIDYYDTGFPSDYSPYYSNGTAYFVFHDPKGSEITTQQQHYISVFMNSFEAALYGSDFTNVNKGYRTYIDIKSFIDYFLIGELTRNVDAYKKSSFFYKDKESKGGLLNFGPVWDFDWAWINLNECFFDAENGSGWAYEIHKCNPTPVPPDWINRLLEDDYFKDNLYTRYYNLRKTVLSENSIFEYIDSVHTLLEDAQQRHYEKWPILGIDVGAPETDDQPETFDGEIEKFKNWITTRLSWLDENMPGNLISGTEDKNKPIYRVFPNPASEFVYFESDNKIFLVEIIDVSGLIIKRIQGSNAFSVKVDLKDISPGIYFTRLITGDFETISGSLIKK